MPAYIEVFEFAPDVRCETYEWDRCVGKIENSMYAEIRSA